MKRQLDMDKIARRLGAERRGKVPATGGYFGAMQLLADVEAKFRVPAGGGRPTDPRWTERRLVPLAPETLERLEEITSRVREHGGVSRTDAARGATNREDGQATQRGRGRPALPAAATSEPLSEPRGRAPGLVADK